MEAVSSSRWRPIVGTLLLLAALASTGRGFFRAATESTDFQWYGAHLLSQGLDPYKVTLSHPTSMVLMNQVPNYLHELYVLTLPLGFLSFTRARVVWACLNLLFAVGGSLLLANAYKLTRWNTYFLVALLLAGTPGRLCLATGQTTLLEMAALALVLVNVKKSGLALGVSYFKYSFSPLLIAYALRKRAWRLIAISAILPVCGLLIMFTITGGSLAKLIVEPVLVSRNNVGMGGADVVTFISLANYGLHFAGIVIAFLLSMVIGFWIGSFKMDVKRVAPVLICIDLLLFQHGTYDFAILVIPLAFLLSVRKRDTFFRVALFCVAFDWYAVKGVEHFASQIVTHLVIAAQMLTLIFCLWQIARSNEEAYLVPRMA